MIGGNLLSNISDIIEQYIKQILKSGSVGYVEIQRNELADRFQCVPSQINYVISTRFTFEKGYIIESKRGGGGYIRIRKMDLDTTDSTVFQAALKLIGSQITQREAEGVIHRLLGEEMIAVREARMLEAAINWDVLQMIPETDQLRANLLSALLIAILKG